MLVLVQALPEGHGGGPLLLQPTPAWPRRSSPITGQDRRRFSRGGRSYAYSFARDLSDLYLVDGLK
jgi:hypothetical protein